MDNILKLMEHLNIRVLVPVPLLYSIRYNNYRYISNNKSYDITIIENNEIWVFNNDSNEFEIKEVFNNDTYKKFEKIFIKDLRKYKIEKLLNE